MYAQQHRAKALRFSDAALESERLAVSGSSPKSEEQRELQRQTTEKAEVNEQLVRDIQSVIDASEHQGIEATVAFADIAYADGIEPKNQQTQIGVHFEEVAEMIEQINSNDPAISFALGHARVVMEDLGHMLKEAEPAIFIVNRVEFLDACCDQLVTASLSARLMNMDPVGGLNEVNRSNYSKLINGKMHKAPITAKWIKGPNYTKPDLNPFV